jgi:hypothetical protein
MEKLEILEEMAKKLFGTDGVSFQKLITYGSLEELVESNYAPDEEEGKIAIENACLTGTGNVFRIDDDLYIEEITETEFEEELEENEEEIVSEYIENFGKDEMFNEYKKATGE